MKEYIKQNLVAFDQQLNTLLGGNADETLSSRAYRAEQNGKPWGKIFRPLIDKIFFWQKSHCYGAYLSEVARRQLPKHFQLDSK